MSRATKVLVAFNRWYRGNPPLVDNIPRMVLKDGREFSIEKLGVHDLYLVHRFPDAVWIGRLTSSEIVNLFLEEV